MLKHILFITLLAGGAYYFWMTRPVTHGPGVVAPSEPVQKQTFGVQNISMGMYTIDPVAEFNIEARVLSKKRYNDQFSDVAPYDFVLGWGSMSDERILDRIIIRQSDRYYNIEMATPPIPRTEMRLLSANLHMAPASPQIAAEIEKIRQGHIIRVKGYLVNIESANGWIIQSSLRRDDYGKEASEVFWIEEFQIL